MIDEDEELTAYHEAGHVVMARLLGGKVRHVTIAPDRDDGPERYGDTEVLWRRGRMSARELAIATVTVCLAGPVAEMIYSGEPYHPGVVGQWAGDWRNAWSAAEELERDVKRRLALLERMTVELYRQLKQDEAWAAIAALADHLLAHETLDAEEVESVIDEWLR